MAFTVEQLKHIEKIIEILEILLSKLENIRGVDLLESILADCRLPTDGLEKQCAELESYLTSDEQKLRNLTKIAIKLKCLFLKTERNNIIADIEKMIWFCIRNHTESLDLSEKQIWSFEPEHLKLLAEILCLVDFITNLNLSANQLGKTLRNNQHLESFYHFLSMIPHINIIDLSSNLLGDSMSMRYHIWPNIWGGLNKVKMLTKINLSNNRLRFNLFEDWHNFCGNLADKEHLLLIDLSNNPDLVSLNEKQWHELYMVIWRCPYLVIEGLPVNIPENLQKLLARHRRWQSVRVSTERLLSNPNIDNFFEKSKDILTELEICIHEMSEPSMEITENTLAYLKNIRGQLSFSSMQHIKKTSSSLYAITDAELNYLLDIPEKCELYLQARIEFFEWTYLMCSSRMKAPSPTSTIMTTTTSSFDNDTSLCRQAFLTAMPACVNQRNELLHFEKDDQNRFDRLLLNAIGIQRNLDHRLSNEARIACLQLLLMINFHSKQLENNTVNTVTTTAEEFSFEGFERLLGNILLYVDSYYLHDPNNQKVICNLWYRFYFTAYAHSGDENIITCLHAVNLEKHRVYFLQKYQKSLNKRLSNLIAFIDALPQCLYNNNFIQFTEEIDKCLLTATNVKLQSDEIISAEARTALLSYVILLYLVEIESTKSIAERSLDFIFSYLPQDRVSFFPPGRELKVMNIEDTRAFRNLENVMYFISTSEIFATLPNDLQRLINGVCQLFHQYHTSTINRP